jgi:hypothetical protein
MKHSRLPVALGVAALAVSLVSCSKNSPTQETPANTPVVSGVSATVVSPGDTLEITGSDFATPASQNQVTFTNPLGVSKPFSGSSTTLRVVVDQDATTGPVSVTASGLTGKGPSVEVRRGIGDFFVFGGLGSSQVLSLPNPTATTKYLVIPHATNASLPYSEDVSYEISTQNTVATASAATAGNAAVALDPNEAFEAWRWEQTREVIERAGGPGRFSQPTSQPGVRSVALEIQQTRQFYVLNTTTGSVISPSSYDRVTAQLRYTGTKCLVYSDVDTFATGNFSGADLRGIGAAFDDSISATDVNYFGPYSDIDNNGKAIILITPVVNRLTPSGSGGFIAGFFLSVDLLSPPNVPANVTNQAEIFYLLAADPSGQTGNTFPIDFTRNENIGTTAHELQHMISFSWRIFHEGGVTQETWLEEGMAHMAEDLNGIKNANISRANIYLNAPGDISLEHNTAPLAQRGGIFLFLRLMADRYGTGILKQIVQSQNTGRASVQAVTGQNFYDLVAQFLAALYLSGKGITADPRFNYTSIDLTDFNPVSVANRVSGGPVVAGNVRRATGDFYLFSGVLSSDSKFTFTDDLGTGRLRQAIVRVQ